jgi:hypothetical protein
MAQDGGGGAGGGFKAGSDITLQWRAERTLEHLKTLVEQSNEWSRESARAFYQAMTTLAAGAIVVSVTFVEKIAPAPRLHNGRLVTAWALFTISLLAILIAFRQLGRERSDADTRMNVWVYKICFGGWEGETLEKSLGPPYDSPQSRFSKALVWGSLAAFGLGVTALVWFATANLK